VTDILVERVEGGDRGQIVSFETQKILNMLLSFGVENIQNECNNVANHYRDLWSKRNPTDFMTEYNLQDISYECGIRELYPQFLLVEPSTIRLNVLNSCLNELYPQYLDRRNVAAAVFPGPMNPVLMIFLPTLEVNGLTITWTNFATTFKSVIMHEFLHLCGDVKTPTRDIVDGVIRHTRIGTQALENLEWMYQSL
jgi:hypothetical protein